MHAKRLVRRFMTTIMLIGVVVTQAATVSAGEHSNQAAQNDVGSIHFLTLDDNTDAILIECNGKYGMVDSGEDSDYPNGNDSGYPKRSGINRGHGHEKEVISYLHSLGVDSSNFEFYIGTHPHSDHIGSADEVIREFHPKKVYAETYDDSMITVSAALWDNQYVYDHLVEAAEDTGAELIQHFNVPGEPDSSSTFYLGGKDGLKIEIYNYDVYENYGPQEDANNFSLGVKVTSEKSGKTAFLSGDINNYNGEETRLAKELGHVDLLKLGHHGNYGSNTDDYISTLNPEVAVLTGNFTGIKDEALDGEQYTSLDTVLRMADRGTPLYCTAFYSDDVPALVFKLDDNLDHQGIPTGKEVVATSRSAAVNYKDGFPEVTNGWKNGYTGGWYYFSQSSQPLKNQFIWYYNCWYYLTNNGKAATGWQSVDGYWYYFSDNSCEMLTGWQSIDGHWYYLNSDGSMATGWKYIDGSWYYLNSDGSMATGWIYIDGQWYYLNPDGSMATGWKYINGKWYYLRQSGAMAAGWKCIDGMWYYMNMDGSMATGWKYTDSNWYYMNGSGQMQACKWINGVYYVKGNGKMAVSEWVDGYYVGADGAWVH